MTEGKDIQYLLPGSADLCECGREATASVGRFEGEKKNAKWIHESFVCSYCLDREQRARQFKEGYMTVEQANLIEPGMTLEPRSNWAQGRMKLPKECKVLSLRKGRSQTGVLVTVEMEKGGMLELDAAWFLAPKDLIPF